MPRKKKLISEKEVEKLRQIDAYDHADKTRTNNPPIGIARYDKVQEEMTKYAYDPNIDPSLQWAGKAEGMSFEVPASSIHIHESIKPSKILRQVQAIGDDYDTLEMNLFWEDPKFADPLERQRRRRDALEFYQHGVDWTNRLIAGDSLVIMNSLLEKEGMAGQVQMCYIDPPYGIKYGSNFQPFINQRDVKDGRDSDLSQEPEMITAFRDTWELGIHSYLSYLRNRLLLVHELLSDTGSVFVQISDENVHHVREICDEIFGPTNFCRQIFFKKTTGQASKILTSSGDYIIWYAKNVNKIKYNNLYEKKDTSKLDSYTYIEAPDKKTWRKMTKQEIVDNSLVPKGWEIFSPQNLRSQGFSTNSTCEYTFEGKKYYCGDNNHWKTTPKGLDKLTLNNRIIAKGNTINYKRYVKDFPVVPISEQWLDTAIAGFSGEEKVYVVQTAKLPISRCMLMTTDPDDLVLDITCGSGTTAYAAEQWGRRWITCDTSRVAIELAKERLMTATFDYFKLAQPKQGISSGFVYKTVPHITLKSIANDEPPATETLYDQPEIDKTKVRISGPFTVESLPAPVVKPLDDTLQPQDISSELSSKQDT